MRCEVFLGRSLWPIAMALVSSGCEQDGGTALHDGCG